MKDGKITLERAKNCYFILVRLVNYRDMSWGVPGCFLQNYGWHSNQITEHKAAEHWNSVLNKMIRGGDSTFTW